MQGWMSQDLRLPSFDLEVDEPRRVALKAAAWLQEHAEAYRDEDIVVLNQDGLSKRDDSLYQNAQDMVVILEDLRSSFNVGSIFRTSECLGIKELWLCGITSKPGDKSLAKTAMGTEGRMAWKTFDSAVEAVKAAKKQGRGVYALETVETARSVFEAEYEFPLALVVGNEALGISQDVLALCDEYISPDARLENSLNVGVALLWRDFIARCWALTLQLGRLATGKKGKLDPASSSPAYSASFLKEHLTNNGYP